MVRVCKLYCSCRPLAHTLNGFCLHRDDGLGEGGHWGGSWGLPDLRFLALQFCSRFGSRRHKARRASCVSDPSGLSASNCKSQWEKGRGRSLTSAEDGWVRRQCVEGRGPGGKGWQQQSHRYDVVRRGGGILARLEIRLGSVA
jgi:hypothetical protein